MAFPRQLTVLTVLALGVACVVVAGHKLSAGWRTPSAGTLPLSRCDPSVEECVADLPGGGTLSLVINPKPIRALEKLSIEVRVTEMQADRVVIDFDGVEMSMGLNRAELSGSNGRFVGGTVLPVCVTGNMPWRATLLVAAGQRQFAVPFNFRVTGRGSE